MTIATGSPSLVRYAALALLLCTLGGAAQAQDLAGMSFNITIMAAGGGEQKDHLKFTAKDLTCQALGGVKHGVPLLRVQRAGPVVQRHHVEGALGEPVHGAVEAAGRHIGSALGERRRGGTGGDHESGKSGGGFQGLHRIPLDRNRRLAR